ncbi:cryptochrome/photolyase family protein [Sulfurovum mangrovi]|uniref:cryptochrome/photolyase family protein n=1 Tax=Sulfurovum mangrovi TaxID=2893889 RepID=UPI001E56058F|nr:deoxyribodipyrimidine photo-lyase [Sulfurovum mangrovi]UFH58476.1 DNA photolyase family protein [Sulfurovum mangrovi]
MRRILWFRRDLRVTDNPLLSLGGEVLPIFIFDTNILEPLAKEDRRVTYIFNRLKHLKESLQGLGLDLKIFCGDPVDVFKVLEREGFDEVAASGDYDSYARERDRQVSMLLPFNALHDTYIFKADEILKDDGTPYLVFTPFYNRARSLFRKTHLHHYRPDEQTLLSARYDEITEIKGSAERSLPLRLRSLGFVENKPDIPSLEEKLELLGEKLKTYAKKRDYPALNATSNLSLELRFGVLGIRELLHFLVEQKKRGVDTEPFLRQLIFRDFYASLLYHFPDLSWKNHRYSFNGIEDQEKFEAFCQGKTGVPIIDAGVRQLLQTGQMHNRVRMICASFFTKDLLLPWQWGEQFFAEHLLDYDAASNILSWQWSAGTGIDPQPYFRIFNPWLQSKKFDREAIYIKEWVPEVANLSAKQIHDETFMLSYHIENYPKPMVVHKEASQEALEYFKKRVGKGVNHA